MPTSERKRETIRATQDERRPAEDSRVHLYWPSEFPIALCGHVSNRDRLPTVPSVSGELCAGCRQKIAPHRHVRDNPHA